MGDGARHPSFGSDAQRDLGLLVGPGLGCGNQLDGSLLERGVLERALHLIGADRVAAAVVEVIGVCQ
jgi:hypothetical protein